MQGVSDAGATGESRRQIENPVINGPFDEPGRHFQFDDDGITDEIVDERRPSGYFVPVPAARNRAEAAEQAELGLFDDDRERIQLNRFVNDVREHVGRWRGLGYPGATATTRHLLEHWQSPDRERRLFFCQVEALETAIFLREAPPALRPRWIDNHLDEANAAANSGLPRIARKSVPSTAPSAPSRYSARAVRPYAVLASICWSCSASPLMRSPAKRPRHSVMPQAPPTGSR